MSTPTSNHTRRSGKPSLKRKPEDSGDELRESRRRRTDVAVAPTVQDQPPVPSSQPSSSRKQAHPDEGGENTTPSEAPCAWYDRPRKLRRTTPPSPTQNEAPGLDAPPRGTKRGRDYVGDDEALSNSRGPATGLHWEPEDLVGMRPAPHAPRDASPPPQLESGTRAGRRRSQRKRRLLASRPAPPPPPSDEEEEEEVLAILFPSPPPPPSSVSESEFGSMVPDLGEPSQQQAPSAPPQAPATTATSAPTPVPLPTPSEQVAQWAADSVEDTLARLSARAQGHWLQDAYGGGRSRRRPGRQAH